MPLEAQRVPIRLDAWYYRGFTCVHVPLAGVGVTPGALIEVRKVKENRPI